MGRHRHPYRVQLHASDEVGDLLPLHGRTDERHLADAARSALAGLDPARPVRLLGVRAEFAR